MIKQITENRDNVSFYFYVKGCLLCEEEDFVQQGAVLCCKVCKLS